MFGINEDVLWQKVEDNGFDDPYLSQGQWFKARVQRHEIDTRIQSNAFTMGQSKTYFTTMDFLDFKIGDKVTYLDETYTITGINKQPNINGVGFLYYKLIVVYNA